MSRCLLVALVWILLPCSWTAAEDWPTYLNDNTRVGATGESLKFPLQLQWQFKADAAPQSAWEGPRNEPIEGLVMNTAPASTMRITSLS